VTKPAATMVCTSAVMADRGRPTWSASFRMLSTRPPAWLNAAKMAEPAWPGAVPWPATLAVGGPDWLAKVAGVAPGRGPAVLLTLIQPNDLPLVMNPDTSRVSFRD
jgi:hypothetical protein